ncbi:hypothetical protein AAG570_001152 [Ranatra chinensis]|uniref:Uncharacterized protein n=1 Tax=Ranatra chinensis TaxID=642074 RepID=A0ABD0YB20_9HEMI
MPQLRTLRHYQLTAALCLLHGQQWKDQKTNLPRYKLTNIDADFSHVVRSRMSPGWVLPVDALRLAVALCPDAVDVRLRFDCSTPHDVASSLTSLSRLLRFSAVCVTSGERTLLDFTDIVPLLEHFGSKTLITLELKVLEEVDPHLILRHCTRLEVLTLSGCGFVAPSTCPAHGCSPQSIRGPQLRLLFYADGDDFSWDHYLPQCFWRTVLFSGDRRKPNRLEGVFLESPRMTPETLDVTLRDKCLPMLRVLSVCRMPEVTMEHLMAAAPSAYLRVSKCDQIKQRHAARIKQLAKIEVKHE